MVSEAGRHRTIALFGEPLAPRHVVERICNDVRDRGLVAVLQYTAKLDNKELSAETMRVSPDEIAAAHSACDKQFLATIRRISDSNSA